MYVYIWVPSHRGESSILVTCRSHGILKQENNAGCMVHPWIIGHSRQLLHNCSRALYNPRLLRVFICMNQTPHSVPVQCCSHLLETLEKQAALTRTHLIKSAPAFRGCRSSSSCPTQPAGRG